MYSLISMECEHQAVTDIELRNQRPSDTHYIFCPTCRNIRDFAAPNKPMPLCWTKVVNVERVSYVHESTPRIMPNDILRLQKGVARSRIRPFPYVRGFTRTDAGITRPSGRV